MQNLPLTLLFISSDRRLNGGDHDHGHDPDGHRGGHRDDNLYDRDDPGHHSDLCLWLMG